MRRSTGALALLVSAFVLAGCAGGFPTPEEAAEDHAVAFASADPETCSAMVEVADNGEVVPYDRWEEDDRELCEEIVRTIGGTNSEQGRSRFDRVAELEAGDFELKAEEEHGVLVYEAPHEPFEVRVVEHRGRYYAVWY